VFFTIPNSRVFYVDLIKNGAYVKVGAQGAVDHRSGLFVCESQHLWLSRVVADESVDVLTRDVDYSVANIPISFFLQLVRVNCLRHIVFNCDSWNRVRWKHFVSWILRNALLVAQLFELATINRTNAEHAFVLDRKLLVLSLITFGVSF
jgi:hypothetical protein